jgi:hypothetical protein
MSTETTTKERPILFSRAMVRAILDGKKTQTRRVCKEALMLPGGEQRGRLKAAPGASEWATAVYPARDSGWIAWAPRDDPGLAEFTKKAYQHGFPCPYGAPGDRLWVRETWATMFYTYGLESTPSECTIYRADHPNATSITGWRPSIHMPRSESRITLEVTGVRVERVQDISEADARAEGLSWVTPTWGVPGKAEAWHSDPREAFRALWDGINEARGYGWASNPWVWVVEFKPINAR